MRETIGRIVGALAGGVAVWLTTKTGQEISVEWIVTGVLAIYGVVHKLVDRKANPADVAKGAKARAEYKSGGPLGTPLR